MTLALLSRCTSPAGLWVDAGHAGPVYQLLCRIHMYGARTLCIQVCVPQQSIISSSDSRSPTDVIGGAASQSPECGDDAANSLALSMSVMACDQATPSFSLSHALWMCMDSAPGVWLLDKEVHLVSTAGRDSSSDDPTDSGRMNC